MGTEETPSIHGNADSGPHVGGRTAPQTTRPHNAPLRCLLDLDSDLSEALADDTRRVARAAALARTTPALEGPIPIGEWVSGPSVGLGVLVIDGLVTADATVAGRTATELVGAGDLVQPPVSAHDELLDCDVAWRAVAPTRFALLDQDFVKRVRFWPQITQVLLRRSASRTYDLNVQRAIAMQPRLEVRLTLLLWHLAARWGKVEPGGLRLSLPLTHQVLGRLVGAERPSVSHALARLAHAGMVTGHRDEWHLHGSVEQRLVEGERDPALGLLVAFGSRRLL
jgi:hypothetical protein